MKDKKSQRKEGHRREGSKGYISYTRGVAEKALDQEKYIQQQAIEEK
mgnify:CR=1 FL=1